MKHLKSPLPPPTSLPIPVSVLRARLLHDIEVALGQAGDGSAKGSILSMLLGLTRRFTESEANTSYWSRKFGQVEDGTIATVQQFAKSLPEHLRLDPMVKALAVTHMPLPTKAPVRESQKNLPWFCR